MSLIDPWITFDADKTPMSPQATQGCEARKGGGRSDLGKARGTTTSLGKAPLRTVLYQEAEVSCHL